LHRWANLAPFSAQSGADLTAWLLSCGFVDMVVAALSAVEQVGTGNANALVVLWGPLMLLTTLDGAARACPWAVKSFPCSRIHFVWIITNETCTMHENDFTAHGY
jgi:hypothetical protein